MWILKVFIESFKSVLHTDVSLCMDVRIQCTVYVYCHIDACTGLSFVLVHMLM